MLRVAVRRVTLTPTILLCLRRQLHISTAAPLTRSATSCLQGVPVVCFNPENRFSIILLCFSKFFLLGQHIVLREICKKQFLRLTTHPTTPDFRPSVYIETHHHPLLSS
ncbi:hypothetical protein SISSUDRAFT_254814 [Sistotremastrum suecicum HHB10207 ss-3]|uniref:Uncharacterized protein n=1 Tax=Sistotremastrum suecicum HHB10207 ss-3 TaxID=1314776 RepID=A0A165ZUC9_9AGAM|nr:hypothetical protein SISSUDRAFT_254814 [Sistotremastrum suecicum HHB10207 ss-3]